MRNVLIVAALVLMGGAARAEGTAEDWAKLAQPIVQEFGDCIWPKVDAAVKSTATPEDIGTAAIDRCRDRLKPLRAVLIKAPFEETQHGVDETVQQILDEMQTLIEARVTRIRRKG